MVSSTKEDEQDSISWCICQNCKEEKPLYQNESKGRRRVISFLSSFSQQSLPVPGGRLASAMLLHSSHPRSFGWFARENSRFELDLPKVSETFLHMSASRRGFDLFLIQWAQPKRGEKREEKKREHGSGAPCTPQSIALPISL